jgi:hypothetical protein
MKESLARASRYLARFCRHPAGANFVGTVAGGIILALLVPRLSQFIVWMLLGLDHALRMAGAAARGPLTTFGVWWNDPIPVARHRLFVYPVVFTLLGYCANRIRGLIRESRNSSDVSVS